jgi:hypothetical protein
MVAAIEDFNFARHLIDELLHDFIDQVDLAMKMFEDICGRHRKCSGNIGNRDIGKPRSRNSWFAIARIELRVSSADRRTRFTPAFVADLTSVVSGDGSLTKAFNL